MLALEAKSPWGLDNLKITERPDPAPARGEVLVRMRAVSLNYRDLLAINGAYGRQMQDVPVVPFSDGCGIVEAIGEGVTRAKIGDRVSTLFFQNWISGRASPEARGSALGGGGRGAGQTLVALSEHGVSRVPEFLSDEQVATLPCAGLTAWRSLFEDARLRPGDVVVLQGTGGVSIFGLQFAKAAGYRTIITSSSDEKLARAKALGADHLINYKTTPEWGREVRTLTNGRGADFVMEVGGGGTLEQSIRAIAVEGHIAIIGVLNNTPPPAALVGHLIGNGAKLQGVFVGSRDMFDKMCAAIALHKIAPVVDLVLPFADAGKAFKAMADNQHFGKIVLKF
jgi:NADPH:quinone reductase-like Zn-dependent oxidoreductase